MTKTCLKLPENLGQCEAHKVAFVRSGRQAACSPISKNVALVQLSCSALSTIGVLSGHGPSSNGIDSANRYRANDVRQPALIERDIETLGGIAAGGRRHLHQAIALALETTWD